MNSQLFFFLAVCFIFMSQSSCSPYTHENRGLCGSRLVDTMAIVCNYHYNSPNKKSVKWNLEDPNDYMDDYNSNALSGPGFRWMDNDINAIIPMRHQRQLGIIEECCKKPCSLNVLRSFCSK